MKKIVIIFTVVSVFLVLVGFSLAAHKLLMDLGLIWEMVVGFAVILLGIYFISKNRGNNRANELAINFALMYMALFLDHIACFLCYMIGFLFYIYEWLKWEKDMKHDTTGCYSRWMTYNLLLLSFVLGGNILFFIKHMISPVTLILTAMLWLAMSVSLSLKLRS